MIEIVVPQDQILIVRNLEIRGKKELLYVKNFTKHRVFLTDKPREAKRVSSGVAKILEKCLLGRKSHIKLIAKKIRYE